IPPLDREIAGHNPDVVSNAVFTTPYPLHPVADSDRVRFEVCRIVTVSVP
ncbi:hypothetical protein I8752_13110, partial [Nostocaceae cyanobacterium CENA369]|nr:hypothetical protein [Dendronalium phyllosphericum CENA369]